MEGFWGRILGKFKSNGFVIGVLVAASFFVYANALLNGFVWDDEEQVVNNTVIRDWKNLPLVFTSSTFYAGGAGLAGGFYRPLVTLSYFFNYSVWGLEPFGYHLMQLLIHCANSVLVFYLLKIILEKYDAANGRAAAVVTALIFAVHPANVESVAYVGSIGEVVYAFFLLSALILSVKSFGENGSITRPRFFYGSFVLVFLGLLAKESAVAALLLLLAYLLLAIRPFKSIYLKFAAGAAGAVVLYLFLRLKVASIVPVSAFYAPIHLASLGQRLMTVPYEIISYIGIIAFPKDLSISRHFVVVTVLDPRFWASTIALALFVAAVLFYIYKTGSRVFSFFVLWFCVTLAPVLNIVPLDMTMAERWLYVPIIGALAAVVVVVVDVFGRMPEARQKIALVFLTCAVTALGIRTIARNGDWRDGLSLYGHDIALAASVSPGGSFDLENNYGVELFRAARYDEAEQYFKRSIGLQPNWASPQNNLGVVFERRGDLEGALAQYRTAAEMGYYLAYENTAGILMKTGRYDEAKGFLETSLAKFPQNQKLQLDLALLYAADASADNKESKQKALYLLSLVLQADPQNQLALQIYSMLREGKEIKL